ncbi:hypothetical protein LGM75_24655 [Burkholderia multivorans]|uniref:hypothetical protein n=1 Tax=Burkholderia multivorans TaxID=87883 RepID=UPI001C244536|nr:hypothetical protein [Burkholderia multivorans]MBU9468612.1 hypothetical protein [Burkholderia multivorans]MCA8129548.1 hypothetical protein [Burkholderia multivorans]
MLTAEARATIMDACQSISRSADALKDCHTIDGDWGDDTDAKAFYDAELRLLGRLTALLAPTQQPSGEVTGWQPIETAPVDTEVVVFWLDPESPEHPERYDFDMLDDGCWRVWTDHYEFAHSVAPAGSRMPLEQPPYTHWKPLGVPADAARAQGGKS